MDMTLRSFFPFSCHLVLCYSLHNSTVFFGGLRGIIFNVCCISMHVLSQTVMGSYGKGNS